MLKKSERWNYFDEFHESKRLLLEEKDDLVIWINKGDQENQIPSQPLWCLLVFLVPRNRDQRERFVKEVHATSGFGGWEIMGADSHSRGSDLNMYGILWPSKWMTKRDKTWFQICLKLVSGWLPAFLSLQTTLEAPRQLCLLQKMWHTRRNHTRRQPVSAFNVPIRCFIRGWKGLVTGIGSLKWTLTSCELIPNGGLVRKSHKMTFLLVSVSGIWARLVKYLVHSSPRYQSIRNWTSSPVNQQVSKVVAISMQQNFCWPGFRRTESKTGFNRQNRSRRSTTQAFRQKKRSRAWSWSRSFQRTFFLRGVTFGWEGAQISAPFFIFFVHPASRKVSQINVGNGKIFWTSKLMVCFDVGWFWWLSSMEEGYSQPIRIRINSLERGKMEVPIPSAFGTKFVLDSFGTATKRSALQDFGQQLLLRNLYKRLLIGHRLNFWLGCVGCQNNFSN